MVDIGILAGTGFRKYATDTFQEDTDYGTTYLALLEISGKKVLFGSRHDRLEVPPQVNYKAMVQAMKKHGVKLLYAVSASGRLGDNVVPGHLVAVNDFWNHDTPLPTFAERGFLLHHGLNPVESPRLHQNLIDAWGAVKDRVAEVYEEREELEAGLRRSGLYVNIQGPGFSTPGEERVFRDILPNSQVVGQTLLREARLLREMDIEAAYLALCTDHSNYPGAPIVSHEIVKANMEYMGQAAVLLLQEVVKNTDVETLDPRFHGLLPGLDPEEVDLERLKEEGGRHNLAKILMRENEALREIGEKLGYRLESS